MFRIPDLTARVPRSTGLPGRLGPDSAATIALAAASTCLSFCVWSSYLAAN